VVEVPPDREQGTVPVRHSPLNEKVCHCPNTDALIKGFVGTLEVNILYMIKYL